jgi:hypothetical protein
MDEVSDADSRPQSQMVLLAKREHARHSLATSLQFPIGTRGRHVASHLKSPFDDFLSRPADTSGERRLKQLLPMR